MEFAASCGLVLDDWQAWCLEHLLGEDEFGRWSASVAIMILPRQNGKNAVLEALELYAFYVLDESRIIHTAQLAKTAADHMRRMIQLVGANPELDAITYPYRSNGKEALERTDTGARLEFITRGRKTVRGGSPSRVVFDEALFLTDDQIQAILPAMSAQSMNETPPQLVYTSSAPLPESLVLNRLRDHAIAGTDPSTFFAEWSLDHAIDLSDEDVLREALYETNPGLGVRISESWLRATELVQMSSEAFHTERLGVVQTVGGSSIVPAGKWQASLDPAPPPRIGEASRVVAWEVSPDRSRASVAWVALRADGNWHQEVVECKAGTDWVAARVAKYVQSGGSAIRAVAVVKGSPGYPVLEDVRALLPDVEVIELSSVEFAAGCGSWVDKVSAGSLRHLSSAWLDAAVSGAVWRRQGSVDVFDRRNSRSDITPLLAATAALRALETVPPVSDQSGGFTDLDDLDFDDE